MLRDATVRFAVMPIALLAALTARAGADPAAGGARLPDAAKARRGLIVHLGCGDGRLAAALARREGVVVRALDADAANVAAARRRFHDAGVAARASAGVHAGGPLPFADRFVNVLIVSGPAPADEEIRRVLTPGGVALVGDGDGGWAKTVLPWPDELDGWSHWNHGPDGNPVSRDRVVGPPRRMQWTDGPAWSKKHWGPRISALVSAGGRVFCVQDETTTSVFNIASRWVLLARDAFNGVVLWRRELPDWTGRPWGPVRRRGDANVPAGLVLGVHGEIGGGSGAFDGRELLAASAETLYMPLSRGGEVVALDAATGEVIRKYENTGGPKNVVLAGELLLVAAGGRIRAIRAATGEPVWDRRGSSPAAADGKCWFFADRCRELTCVGLADGKQRWTAPFVPALKALGVEPPKKDLRLRGWPRAGCGVVLAEAPTERRRGITVAFDAATGKPLWSGQFGGKAFGRGSEPFFIDGAIRVLDSGRGVIRILDPRTGEQSGEVPVPAIRYVGHHARCYRARATARFILAKERGADFVNLDTGEVSWQNWVRGPCHRGVIPANGLVYIGQNSCRCYSETALHGFHALAPATPQPEGAGAGKRLVRGPAWKALAGVPAGPPADAGGRDWPTWRHDAARSGATPCELPERMDERWAAELGGRLTAPVVAGGTLYVADKDAAAVHALDAATGRPRWRFLAGGRVDSPPTVLGPRVLFGCADGWVYCLATEDGRLAWRFRAAPAERMVGSDGGIASAWPVHGSVLVTAGAPGRAVAYVTAGRSSFLDGGLYVLGIDPATGELLHERHIDGPWPGPEVGADKETPNRGYVISGALADVLSAKDGSLYLRQLRFDPALATMEDMQPNFYKSPALSGENRGGDHKYWDNLVEAPRHALFSDAAWFHRSFFQNFPGLRLYATTGLLDGAWHRRMYWSYGQVVGQYIVFRGRRAWAVQVFATSPREGGMNAGDGYVVHAGESAAEEQDEKLFALRPRQSAWRVRMPFRPEAMALAGGRLVLAGPPDAEDPAAALAALDGRKGAVLRCVSAGEGKTLDERTVDWAPVRDGLAVAGGKLYVSTRGGAVVCLGAR